MDINQTMVSQQPNVDLSLNSMMNSAQSSTQGRVERTQTQEIQKIQDDVAKNVESGVTKVDSQEKMNDLIDKLNDAIDPFKTSLRFGFDNKSDNFFVSIIDTKTSEMIRRFPAEDATTMLEKMNEVSGVLFDKKG
jgi:flagellar protein FlaG